MVQVNPKTGETRPIGLTARSAAGNGRTTAAIQKAVAQNQTQLSIIDDALSELGRHESAVGLSRYAGDAINQRIDPQGINARASIANVGSMIVHDRSGAAVTVSEYPRLAPFVPKVTDTPRAIRDKLAKLKAAIQTETSALQTAPTAAVTPTNGPPGDVDLAKPDAPVRHDIGALKAKYGLQ